MPVFPFKGVWPTIADDVFIAPGAMIIGDVTVLEGASIWYNAVVRGDVAPIVIGRRTNIQDNCTLHVDAGAPLTIGEECTVGHGAVLHGATVVTRASAPARSSARAPWWQNIRPFPKVCLPLASPLKSPAP